MNLILCCQSKQRCWMGVSIRPASYLRLGVRHLSTFISLARLWKSVIWFIWRKVSALLPNPPNKQTPKVVFKTCSRREVRRRCETLMRKTCVNGEAVRVSVTTPDWRTHKWMRVWVRDDCCLYSPAAQLPPITHHSDGQFCTPIAENSSTCPDVSRKKDKISSQLQVQSLIDRVGR